MPDGKPGQKMDENWPMGPEDGIPEDDVAAMGAVVREDAETFFLPPPYGDQGRLVRVSPEARLALLRLVELDHEDEAMARCGLSYIDRLSIHRLVGLLK